MPPCRLDLQNMHQRREFGAGGTGTGKVVHGSERGLLSRPSSRVGTGNGIGARIESLRPSPSQVALHSDQSVQLLILQS